ncbi:MAG: MFS transporter [Candidatus Bipolaricaulota bacterium]|nr:MAG: MFS transporter [Candidatus Bipolaricaulota bacterium]
MDGKRGASHRKLLLFVFAASLTLTFGHQVWQAMFNNFAVEEIGVGPQAVGWIQSVREVPGLLAFVVAFLALVITEMRVMALGLIFLGSGIALVSQVHGLPMLLVATLVMSVGFHFFNPCSSSVVLMSTEAEHAPRVLGRLRSLGAVASLAATGVVYALAGTLGYRPLFAAVGLAVVAVGLVLLPFGRRSHDLPTHRKIRLRRRYALFYALAFLMGSRRHIFTTFAVFLLVSRFGITVQTTATLFLVNALVNTVAYRWVGWLVGRIGERTLLSVAFATLIPVFLGYAYVPYLPVLYVLFVIDNILFGFNMGLTTYLQKIAVTREELTSNLSLQETINHISAVVVPVLGGTIWAVFGAQAPFLVGVGIAALSLLLARFIRVPTTSGDEGDAPATPAVSGA